MYQLFCDWYDSNFNSNGVLIDNTELLKYLNQKIGEHLHFFAF